MVKRFNIRLSQGLMGLGGHLGFRTWNIKYITHSQNFSFSWTEWHGSDVQMNGTSYLQSSKLIRIIRKWSLTARPLYRPYKNISKNRPAEIFWIFGGWQHTDLAWQIDKGSICRSIHNNYRKVGGTAGLYSISCNLIPSTVLWLQLSHQIVSCKQHICKVTKTKS